MASLKIATLDMADTGEERRGWRMNGFFGYLLGESAGRVINKENNYIWTRGRVIEGRGMDIGGYAGATREKREGDTLFSCHFFTSGSRWRRRTSSAGSLPSCPRERIIIKTHGLVQITYHI